MALFASHFSNLNYRWLRTCIAVIAWGILITSVWFITPQMLFPGWIALIPTLATALIIAAGTDTKLPVLEQISCCFPIRTIGDASYSIYLWHWPLIVILPFALGTALTFKTKLILISLTLVIGYLSKIFIEDKSLHHHWFVASVKRTFTAMFIAIFSFAAVAYGLNSITNRQLQIEEEKFQAALQTECVGPNTLTVGTTCKNKLGPLLTNSLGEEHNYYKAPTDCTVEKTRLPNGEYFPTLICDFREAKTIPAEPADVVMLIGDSHADQWKWPLYELAKKHHKRLEVKVFAGCPLHDTSILYDVDSLNAGLTPYCALSGIAVTQQVIEQKPGTVVYSNYGKFLELPPVAGKDLSQQELYNQALTGTWKQWTDAGVQQVLVVADTPYNNQVRDTSCWNTMPNPAVACRVPRKAALGHDPLPEAVRLSANPKVTLADFTDAYCDTDYCYAVVGQMPVYFDDTHVSRQYILRLVPRLEPLLTVFSKANPVD